MNEEKLFVLNVDELRKPLTQDQRLLVMDKVASSTYVESVAHINSLPFQGQESSFALSKSIDSEKLETAFYFGTQNFIETLDAKLLFGRSFERDEFVSGIDPFAHTPSIILTESLARRLSTSVGGTVYLDGRHVPVIGIIADVLRPEISTISEANYAALLPVKPQAPGQMYLIARFKDDSPAGAGQVAVEVATRATSSDYVWSGSLLAEERDRYFRMDRLVGSIMFSIGAVLLIVVAGGIGGLSNYWIVRRERQTFVRRALGATKRDIELFFRVENLAICVSGIFVGLLIVFLLRRMFASWLGIPEIYIGEAAAPAFVLLLVAQVAITIPIKGALKE